jgi:O-antigen/teichoic acid export membrane protein
MNLKIQALKNIASSWMGLGVTIVVGFFLSPYILHHLGDEAFGLWVLIFSLTGYYGIFDFGIRSALIRYVAKFVATKDEDGLARLINTNLFLYSCIGLALFIPTILGGLFVDKIFRVPASFHRDAQTLFFMVGTSLALGFPLGMWGGVLEGLQKFYLLNLTNILSSPLRAVLVVIALKRGYGLLMVAFITIAIPMLASVVQCILVQRLIRVPYSWRYIDRASFRQVANYSSITFILIVAGRLRFKTDAIIIGTFLSASAITYFSIAGRLVDYATDVVGSLAQIFTPMSSEVHAAGDFDRLRKIFLHGNRACAFTMFPISVTLVVLGKSVIEAWVGPRYVSSYIVLLILIIPSTLYFAQATSTRILFGTSWHRPLAAVAMMEAAANIILSIVLVRHFGIIGDAVGTAIPLLCTCLFFLPRHLCRKLQVPMLTFLRESYLFPLLFCIPMVLALLLMQRLFYAHNYGQLLVQVLVGSAVYGAGVLWFFLKHEPMGVELRARMAQYF